MLDGYTVWVIIATAMLTLVLNSMYVTYTFGSWKGKIDTKIDNIFYDINDVKSRISRIEDILMKKENK